MLVSEVIMPRMTELEASDLAARAMDAALRKGLHIAVAVVDSAGQLLVFRRDRDAFPTSIELAIAKARTAATFRRDTKAMQQSLEQGRLSYLALPGALPLAGGVPLMVRGVVIGALGISGASSTEDAELVLAVAHEVGWAGDLA